MNVTVIVPIYNADLFLKQSIESILAQTYSDFELLAINDGSTDTSGKTLESFSDERLKIINNDRNLGLIYTLNRGIKEAKGKYIARMDADDIANPERLALQVSFLEKHSEVALLGGGADLIDENGTSFMPMSPPCLHKEIIEKIFLGSCFIHPSVMFRTNVVRKLGGYRAEALHAEDYDLWLRIIQYHEVANLAEKLIQYRVHPGQVSQRQLRQQRSSADNARFEAYNRFKQMGTPIPDDDNIHNTLWQHLAGVTPSLGGDYLRWIYRYRAMGRDDLANKLIIPGIASAPLCKELYQQLFRPITRSNNYRSLKNRMQWYKVRIKNILHL